MFVSVFNQKIKFSDLNIKKKNEKQVSELRLEKMQIFCYDLIDGKLALGLNDGIIFLIYFFTNHHETFTIKLKEDSIKKIKFIGKGDYLFVSTIENENLVLNLTPNPKYNSTLETSVLLSEYEILSLHDRNSNSIEFVHIIEKENFFVDESIFFEIWILDKLGNIHQTKLKKSTKIIAVNSEESKENKYIIYLRTHNIIFKEDQWKDYLNENLQRALEKPTKISVLFF